METEGLSLSFEKMVVSGEVESANNLRIGEWNDIPAELLLRILTLADDRTVIMASGVCHGWRDAISWGHTHLSLYWCKKNMNDLVMSLIPKFTKLESLILRQDTPQLLDHAIETIAVNCHELQELDLSKSCRLTDLSLYALAGGCPNLMKLNISGCSAFTDTALGYMTGFCTKLKFLNLCGCVRAASDMALKAIGNNCSELQSLNLGWCDHVGDEGVKSLAYGCPHLRALNLCGCVLITDESIIALANKCLKLRSLGLYYCQNITDRAMYSLAQNRVKNKHQVFASMTKKYNEDDDGLTNLNISQCTALTPPAVQAVCDSFPSLHTCPGRHSLIISGCLSLTSVHCACAIQPHPTTTAFPHLAH